MIAVHHHYRGLAACSDLLEVITNPDNRITNPRLEMLLLGLAKQHLGKIEDARLNELFKDVKLPHSPEFIVKSFAEEQT